MYSKQLSERKKSNTNIRKSITEAKRLTSGTMSAYGIHSLNNSDFIAGYEQNREIKLENEKKKAEKKLMDTKKYHDGVQNMRSSYGHESKHLFKQCNKDECRDYLQ